MQPFYERREHSVQIGFPRFPFPPHLHAHVEIMHALSGLFHVMIDGREYRLSPGDTAIAFSNHVHGYGANEESAGIMLVFPPEISVDFGRILMTRQPLEPVLRAQQAHPDIDSMMRALQAEALNAGDETAQRAYIQVILARLLPALSLQKASPQNEHNLLLDAMAYLSEHFDQPVTLETLAKTLGASQYHLSHLFSERLGMNFRSYINALRIERARLLLTRLAAPITQICYECGFENQRTFNRAFRSVCGITPTQYRENLKK